MSTPRRIIPLLLLPLLAAVGFATPTARRGPPQEAEPRGKEKGEGRAVSWAEALILEGEHYRVTIGYSSREVAQAYLDLLESAHPALGDLFEGIHRRPRTKPADVYILPNRDDFLALTARTGIVGFYSSGGSPGIPPRTMLTYHGAAYGSEKDTRAVLLHQAALQFVDIELGGCGQAPPWLRQGTAVLFETCRIEGGKVILRDEKRTGVGLVPRLLLTVLQRGIPVKKEPYVPLKSLLRTPQPDFGGYHYAHGWSLVHWMVNGDGGKHRPIFVDLWKTAQERSIKPDEVETVIRNATGHDIDEFEEKVWKPYVLGLVPEPTGDVKGDQFTSRTMRLKVSRPGPGWDWVLDDLPVNFLVRMENPEAEARIDISADRNDLSPKGLRKKSLFERIVEEGAQRIYDETFVDREAEDEPEEGSKGEPEEKSDEWFEKRYIKGFLDVIKISGYRAAKFTYASVMDWQGPAEKKREVAATKVVVTIPTRERIYRIVCECPVNQAENLMADFDKVIRSFQIGR